MIKQKITQIEVNGTIWVLAYVEKGTYFPDDKTKAYVSGVWICKLGYSWKFSYYQGENLNIAIERLNTTKQNNQP